MPINQLVKVAGTPLQGAADVDPFDFVRTIAVARLLMPRSHVRLSAGRQEMSDEMQALCFLAGANSIFYGEKLLTTGNPDVERDRALMTRLGIEPLVPPGLAAAADTMQAENAERVRGPDIAACAGARTGQAGFGMQRDPAALKAALADLDQRHLRRRRRVGAGERSQFLLERLPRVGESIRRWCAPSPRPRQSTVGGGASHLVTGHGPEHEALELALAMITGREKALVYSTGYMANVGIIGALGDSKLRHFCG